MALRNPSEQLSLIRKANSMKKLSRQPMSKCEQRGLQRIQARLLREHRALSEKDHAAQVSAEKWVQRVRKQLQARIAASLPAIMDPDKPAGIPAGSTWLKTNRPILQIGHR